jgi:hypothetical protein
MKDRTQDKTTFNAAAAAPLVPLTGLFDEMQALMALMPGAALDMDRPLSSDEETEAMFDNMPV